MKIIKNTSKCDTKTLMSLFAFIHNMIAKTEGKLSWWKSLRIQISSGHNTGHAYLGRTFGKFHIHLSISPNDLLDLSQLFAHELLHVYGFDHGQYPNDPLTRDQLNKINTRFADVSLLKKTKEKRKINKVAQRYERMLARQKSWNRKLKLAQTNLAKVQKEIKHYEKTYSDNKRTVKYLDEVE